MYVCVEGERVVRKREREGKESDTRRDNAPNNFIAIQTLADAIS